MGCWGMGIAQSDEYCTVYERFIEEYDEGKPVADITNDILEDYYEDFSPEDGILHDVYFALGKGQWMCGGISRELLERVTKIVENGENLAFYKELGASEKDLKQRQKNLVKFLAGLQVPRPSPRKRKKPESAYIAPPKPKPLPKVAVGDLLAYQVEGKWRVLMVTFIHKDRLAIYAQCFLWNSLFDEIPSWEALNAAKGLMFAHVDADAFPKEFQIIGHSQDRTHALMAYVYNRPWASYLSRPARKEEFFRPLPENLCFPYGTAMQKGLDYWHSIHNPPQTPKDSSQNPS